MSRITQQELESYLWCAAVLLRGLIDAGDYKQFIFPLLFYKRVSDVWDEEYQAALANSGGDLSYAQFAENHRFQIPEGAHWNDVRQSPKNVGAAIQKAMRAIETANPDLLDGIFGDAPWTNRERLPDETLKNLIEHFSTQTLSVANVPEDELGNAYEYLIKKFADDSGHTAAEFYTNRTVVHLMTQLLAPQAGESIYDPTCGTGGMLISALDGSKTWDRVTCRQHTARFMLSFVSDCYMVLNLALRPGLLLRPVCQRRLVAVSRPKLRNDRVHYTAVSCSELD